MSLIMKIWLNFLMTVLPSQNWVLIYDHTKVMSTCCKTEAFPLISNLTLWFHSFCQEPNNIVKYLAAVCLPATNHVFYQDLTATTVCRLLPQQCNSVLSATSACSTTVDKSFTNIENNKGANWAHQCKRNHNLIGNYQTWLLDCSLPQRKLHEHHPQHHSVPICLTRQRYHDSHSQILWPSPKGQQHW